MEILPQVDIAQIRRRHVVEEKPIEQPLTKRQISRQANKLEKNETFATINPVIGAVELLDKPKKLTRKQRINSLKDAVVDAFLGKEDDPNGVKQFTDYVEGLKGTKPQIAIKLLEKVMDEKEDLTVINTQAPIIIMSSGEFSQQMEQIGENYETNGSIPSG